VAEDDEVSDDAGADAQSEGADAGEMQISLPEMEVTPEGSIELYAEYIEWLEAQPVPSNVAGIDASITHSEAAPNA
jgi:hypothetical protein